MRCLSLCLSGSCADEAARVGPQLLVAMLAALAGGSGESSGSEPRERQSVSGPLHGFVGQEAGRPDGAWRPDAALVRREEGGDRVKAALLTCRIWRARGASAFGPMAWGAALKGEWALDPERGCDSPLGGERGIQARSTRTWRGWIPLLAATRIARSRPQACRRRRRYTHAPGPSLE